MSSEDYIKKKLGKRNLFSVPDGYFDSLSSEVMARLPERHTSGNIPADSADSNRHNTYMRLLRPILYVAASAVICVFGVYTYLTFDTEGKDNVAHIENSIISNSTDAYTDAVADYAMMDNADIYAYLYDE